MADLNSLFAEEYDSTKSYVMGNKCVFEKQWYQCKEDTTGEFDETKWKKKYLVDYMGGSNSNKPELLWENPSSALTFAAQTLNIDLSKYSHIIISCVYGANASYSSLPTYSLLEVNGKFRNISCISDNEYAVASRKVTVSETSIVFSSGSRVNMFDKTCSVGENVLCIPQKIYGVNMTL